VLSNDLILVAVAPHASTRCGIRLEVISITQGKSIVRLSLPFQDSWQVEASWRSTEAEPIGSTAVQKNERNTLPGHSWYYRDPTSERVGLYRLDLTQLGGGGRSHAFYMVISTKQLLRVIRSRTNTKVNDAPVERSNADDCRTLTWSEWGPESTRWFRNGGIGFTSVFSSYVYFSGIASEFLGANKLSSKSQDD
jgi:hypothetical protein